MVAANYEEQINGQPWFVIVTEDILTDYGETFLCLNQLVEAGMINEKAKQLMIELDKWFEYNPNLDNEYLITLEALKNSDYWQHARMLASKILEYLKPARKES